MRRPRGDDTGYDVIMDFETSRAFVNKVARLYLSSELTDSDPVEPVEVLDSLIVAARDLTGESPEDL
jgi:hypothetical protein